MKLFDGQTTATVIEDACAELVMETVPLVMGTFKGEMRRHRPADMTVPQFRALIFLRRHAGASLSNVAEFLGLTLSTTSKLVDGLVKRHFITRELSPTDRRKIILVLTDLGQSTLDAAYRHAKAQMTDLLSGLADEERPIVQQAMQALQRVFIRQHGCEVKR